MAKGCEDSVRASGCRVDRDHLLDSLETVVFVGTGTALALGGGGLGKGLIPEADDPPHVCGVLRPCGTACPPAAFHGATGKGTKAPVFELVVLTTGVRLREEEAVFVAVLMGLRLDDIPVSLFVFMGVGPFESGSIG